MVDLSPETTLVPEAGPSVIPLMMREPPVGMVSSFERTLMLTWGPEATTEAASLRATTSGSTEMVTFALSHVVPSSKHASYSKVTSPMKSDGGAYTTADMSAAMVLVPLDGLRVIAVTLIAWPAGKETSFARTSTTSPPMLARIETDIASSTASTTGTIVTVTMAVSHESPPT